MKNKLKIPPVPIHPGEYILDELQYLEMTVKELSTKTQISEPVLQSIINRKKDITPEIAVKIEKAIGFPAESLMKLQMKYHQDTQITNIKKHLQKTDIPESRKRKILKAVMSFFGLA